MPRPALVDPIVIPTAPPPPRRRGLPVLASIAPVVAAVIMWMVTGSSLVLWFALLGPLVALAGLADGRRTARREAALARMELTCGRADARRAVEREHTARRESLEAAHPDVLGFMRVPNEIWRPERSTLVTVGRGMSSMDLRVVGDDEIAAEARLLSDAPQPVDLLGGVCVVGPRVAATAIARALVLQACLALPPGRLRIVERPEPEGVWTDALPHRIAGATGFGLALIDAGRQPPATADGVIAVVPAGAPLPPWCAARVTVRAGPVGALDVAGDVREVMVEGVSRAQAAGVAHLLAERASRLSPAVESEPVRSLATLLSGRVLPRGSLRAAFGDDPAGPVSIDLVADGPHALVVGVTGTGKSELLVSWVVALATAASTSQVTFLLADFKGGTAFDALRSLPHVTGVITDLDGDGAPRAIESLRAELRRRERVIAAAGARDIDGCGDALARLVIVVDEFAALLADHPELQRVFVDIAARGRALGMHLVLGTQRAGGVIRDALLTNCALRICLRVGDAAESRLLLGSDDAAMLPGGLVGRGHAFVRRAGDAAPQPMRVALSAAADVRAAASAAASDVRPSPVWLPALPERLELADLIGLDRSLHDAPPSDAPSPDALRFALVDEPERQQRRVLSVHPGSDRGVAVVGGPGSGKTNVLAVLARQFAGPVIRVGPDVETAWDDASTLDTAVAPRSLILIDDVDAVASAMPPEYEAAFLAALTRVVRAAHGVGSIVGLTSSRVGGPYGRLADLLPLRLVLRAASRVEHLAAGGDPATHLPHAPAGRGSVGGRSVQVPHVEAIPVDAPASPPLWRPRARESALVVRSSSRRTAALAAEWADARVVDLSSLGAAAGAATPARSESIASGRPLVFVGDPDHWQRNWALLTDVRTSGDLVVSTECATHMRVLTGSSELPPLTRSGPDRAWASDRGASMVRVRLPWRG